MTIKKKCLNTSGRYEKLYTMLDTITQKDREKCRKADLFDKIVAVLTSSEFDKPSLRIDEIRKIALVVGVKNGE